MPRRSGLRRHATRIAAGLASGYAKQLVSKGLRAGKTYYNRAMKYYYGRKLSIPYTPRISGFPTRQSVKLRWVENVQLNPALGSMAYYRFRANSIHQPDLTSASTHQPRGHDQWAQVYDHYTVIGSKIMVSGFNNAGNVVPGVFGLYLDDTSSNTFASVTDAIETTASKGRYRMIGS